MKELIVTGLVLFGLAGCQPRPSSDVILAQVGDDVITAREFQLNYEFGHGHLRRGDDPRAAYLQFMVLELALAQEAQSLQLDTSAAIVHALHTLREELLIERVFEEKVLAKIQITEADIRHAINADAVRFQFRFLPARTEAEASELKITVDTWGYEAGLEASRERFAELQLTPGALESPFVEAHDIEPEIFAVLQELPKGRMSSPVKFGDWWYVFEVTGIHQQPVAPDDYENRSATYEKIVYNRKALEEATAYINDLMTPLGVTTRRAGFETVKDALWDWYEAETPERNLLYYIEERKLDTDYARKLSDNYNVPLVEFGDEAWTIRTFLEHFTPGRYSLRVEDQAVFDVRVADIIALVVRDAVLLEIAESERLYRDASFQRTLTLWKKKWLFQEYRKLLLNSADLSEAEIAAYYAQKNESLGGQLLSFDQLSVTAQERIRTQMQRDRLAAYADSLARGVDFEINREVLDTLSLSHSQVNPQMTVHLLKSNSNKMPFPIADPNWRTPLMQ